MTGAPELDEGGGRLLVGEATLRVLVAHAADPVDVALQGPAPCASSPRCRRPV